MDKLAFRRHAHIPDFAVLSVEQSFLMDQHRVRAVAAVALESAVHDDDGLPDSHVRPGETLVLRSYRSLGVGILELFCDNNRRRPHMEVHRAGIYSAAYCRPGASLPGALYYRNGAHGRVGDDAAGGEPSADELLFCHGDALRGSCLSGRRLPPQGSAPLAGGLGAGCCGRRPGLGRERSVALQHI